MHVYPPPIFASYFWFVPYGTVLFYALWKFSGGLIGCAGFISQTVSRWYSILCEGDMFHDLSEVNLSSVHFRRDCLKVLQGDAEG